MTLPIGAHHVDEMLIRKMFNTKEPQAMTSEQAYTTIKALRQNGKKKFSDNEKRALEHALVLIAQAGFEDMIARKEGLGG